VHTALFLCFNFRAILVFSARPVQRDDVRRKANRGMGVGKEDRNRLCRQSKVDLMMFLRILSRSCGFVVNDGIASVRAVYRPITAHRM
jgi:hypothetical protein